MKRARVAAVALGIGFVTAWTTSCASEADPRPNVVLIVADDLGYGQLGSYGSAEPTPVLDRLASSGVRLTDGYAAAPICLPSRASLLTGLYHQRFRDAQSIPRRHRMLMQVLQQAGYATGCIGKWHQGVDTQNHPLEWGCDEFFGFLGGLHDYHAADLTLDEYRRALPDASYSDRIRLQRFSPILAGTREVDSFDYLTRELSERAVDFIRREGRRRSRPFLLYLAYNAIHGPLQSPDVRQPPVGPRRGDVTRDMIRELDVGVGRVLDTLEEEDLRKNTLVVFTSDNGALFAPGLGRVNGPLRGAKASYAEGGLRVPFVWSWPAGLPAGTVYRRPVSQLDILPTVVAAAGAEILLGEEIDGVDLLPFLRGNERGEPHAVLYWGDREGRRYALRSQRWKLLRDRDGEPARLFDLVRDPGEQIDLAQSQVERVRVMQAQHAAWSDVVATSRDAK